MQLDLALILGLEMTHITHVKTLIPDTMIYIYCLPIPNLKRVPVFYLDLTQLVV